MRLVPDDSTLLDFGGEFLVVCPRCAQQARVRDRGSEAAPRTRTRPARGASVRGRTGRVRVRSGRRRGASVALTCPHCGLCQFWAASEPGTQHSVTAADPRRYPAGVVAVGGPVDWYFHLPLWLQTGCCGETLWAYNPAHLSFIEDYVRATLREHARGEHGWRNQALRNRLPGWIKDAKNREDILTCVEKLREKV